jgi:rhodanese-related sulfurtransferase
MTADTIREIDPHQAKALLDAGKAILIDVREAHEFAAARIPSAALHPLSTFDPAAHAGLKGKHVIVACQLGGRSMRAATALAPVLGAANVVSLGGGLAAWQAAGLPVAVG